MLPEIQFEEFLREYTKRFERDTQFLVEQGWIDTGKTEYLGEKVFSVWRSPDGKEYPHQTSLLGSNKWSNAIDVANRQLIKQHFGEFDLFQTCPSLSEASNKRKSRNGTIWEECFGRYYKHDSKRVYSQLEARDICRLDMRDLDPNECCGETLDLQRIFDTEDIVFQEGMKLYVNFGPDETQYNEEEQSYEYVHIFSHVEY